MALHPIEQAPPVLYLQVELLRALGVLCSSSFEGCHGEVGSGVLMGVEGPTEFISAAGLNLSLIMAIAN